MTPEALQQQRVTVVGGARSGVAVARLLRAAGAVVFLTERAALEPSVRATLEGLGVAYETNGHTRRALEADMVVVSPGVPSTAPLVQQAQRIGLPVYSEIETASWFCPAPIVAITGTNGKTTTTSLLGHLFRTADRAPIVAGNIGYPFADYVPKATPRNVVVLEVSSFQLDHVDTFRPKVSILLNITPDHLDRYNNNFNAYAQAKFRIFANQQDGDVLIYNYDDRLIREHVAHVAPKRSFTPVAISQHHEVPTGAFVRDGTIILRIHQQEDVLMQANKRAPALSGRHNLYNSLAAAVAGRVMEVRSDVVRESLTSFEGVPHRLEFVRTVDGVRYINDSKATNVNAVWYALESFNEPLVLLAGGRDKGNDYSSLKPLVRQKARAVIALGESADTVMQALGTLAPHATRADTMEEALRHARLFAEPGDVVLLSPACSSFDMFDNYEHRGDTFRRLVNRL